jgi:hypothetical protein
VGEMKNCGREQNYGKAGSVAEMRTCESCKVL